MGHLPDAPEEMRDQNQSFMNRLIAGCTAAVTVTGGLWLTGLGLAAGAAHANPPGCGQYSACWCPGQPLPGNGVVLGEWDHGGCHDFHWASDDFPPGPHGPVEQGPKPRDPACPPWATIFSGPAQCGGL
jgi:hypothetical protein